MKRSIILAVLLCFVMAMPVVAAPDVMLDGKPLHFTDASPTIEKDRTPAPLRFVVEAFGGTVEWNQATQLITITTGQIFGTPQPAKNIMNYTAILIALLSLVISYIALHLTVLKKGELEIIIFNEPDDVDFAIGGRHDGVATNFYLTFVVLVKNKGAQPVAFKKIIWRVDSTQFFDVEVFGRPEFYDINGIIVERPYEQMVGTIQLKFLLKGHGKGYDNPEYQKAKEQAAVYKGDPPCFIEFEYDLFTGKHKIDHKKKRIPISDIIVKYLTE